MNLRTLSLVSLTVGVGLALTACTPADPGPTVSAAASDAAGTVAPDATATDPAVTEQAKSAGPVLPARIPEIVITTDSEGVLLHTVKVTDAEPATADELRAVIDAVPAPDAEKIALVFVSAGGQEVDATVAANTVGLAHDSYPGGILVSAESFDALR